MVAWVGYTGASAVGFEVAAASGVGAFLGSFIGMVVAYRLHVPSVAVTTAAILPMVPGAAVFRGLLGIVESGDDAAVLMTGV
ncbi:threonine/serine exporter family protein, partial [Microbacterium sp. B19]|uniref:threonine/serine exporter family protein n=1 Tax=Microbacterium sp. B19 TaxID=96765 RepID=UPI0004761AF4